MALVKVGKSLNRAVVNVISAADFPGPSPVVGVAVDDVAATPVTLTAIAASFIFFDPVDESKVVTAQVFVQEGLRMTERLQWASPDEDHNKQLLSFYFKGTFFERMELRLDPGKSYGIGLALFSSAVPVSFIAMSITATGGQESLKGSPRLKG